MDLKKYAMGLSKAQIGLIVFIFAYLYYIVSMTSPVPNFDPETNTLLYTEGSLVPPTYVSSNHFLFIIILIGILISSFLVRESKSPDRIDIKEARKIVDDYLKSIKTLRLESGEIITIGSYHIDKIFLTRYNDEKNETKAYRYVLQIMVKATSGITHYFKGYVHPYTRYMDGLINIDAPLEDKDQCSNCGREFDFKFMDADDFRKFKKMKESWAD